MAATVRARSRQVGLGEPSGGPRQRADQHKPESHQSGRVGLVAPVIALVAEGERAAQHHTICVEKPSTTHQQAQRRGRARNTLQLGCGRSGSNHRASRRQSQRPLYPGCCARLIRRRGEPLCQAPTFPTRRRRSLGWVIGEECRRCKSGRSQQLVALAMAAAHPGTVTGRDRDPWDGLSARCGLAQCRREANFL